MTETCDTIVISERCILHSQKCDKNTCVVYLGMKFKPLPDSSQVRVPQIVYRVCNKGRGYCNTRCKGSSTQYGRPQVAGLRKFVKFLAGESVTRSHLATVSGKSSTWESN